MTTYSITSKRNFLWLAGVSSLALLSGCSISSMKNPFTDEHTQQVVAGDRHPPVLNTAQPGTMPTPVPAGAPTATVAAAPVPFVMPVAKTAARKPLPGNPSAAPVATAPVAAVNNDTTLPPPAATTDTQTQDVQTVYTKIPRSVPVSNDSSPPWRMREPFSVATTDVKHDTLHAKEVPVETKTVTTVTTVTDEKTVDNGPVPALSSVPPTPPALKAAQTNSAQNLRDLQAQHRQAQEDKKALDSEPSTQNSTVVPQTTPAPAVIPQVIPPAAATTPDVPGAPRRGVDIMTQEQWDALQKARQQNNAEPAASAGPQTYLAPHGDPSLVQLAENMNMMSDVKPDASVDLPPPTPMVSEPQVAPVEVAAPQEAAPETHELPPSRYAARARALQSDTPK